MKKRISIAFILIFIIESNFLITLSSGLTCQLKSGTCSFGEICVFSLNQSTNSHAGNCTYGNMKVCCSDTGILTATIQQTPCSEGGIIRLNRELNSHVENYTQTNYNYRVCLSSTSGPTSCINRPNSCAGSEAGIISLFSYTNSHAANYSDSNFQIKVCCIITTSTTSTTTSTTSSTTSTSTTSSTTTTTEPYNFNFWVAPKVSVYTVGKETTIKLYIQNTGGNTDSYTITANVSNPYVFRVDMSSASFVNDVAVREIRRVYPTINVLATGISGEVFFNATSQGNKTVYRNATLKILESNLPMSLSEFDSLGFIALILLVGIIYFVFKYNLTQKVKN